MKSPAQVEYLWLPLAALVGLFLLLFLYPRQHPDSVASYALGTEEAITRSSLFLEELGYRIESLTPRAQLRRYIHLLDSLQADLGRPQAIQKLASGWIERVPAYYWEVTWQNRQGKNVLLTNLTQSGHPWRLLNRGDLSPTALPSEIQHLSDDLPPSPDSLALRHARAYLAQIPMADAGFVLDSLKHLPSGRTMLAFHSARPLLKQQVSARLVLLPNGRLHTLDITFNGEAPPTSPQQSRSSTTFSFQDVLGFIRALLYFSLLLIAALTLLRRLRARVVDLNAVLRDSLVGGLALALFIFNVSFPSIFQSATLSPLVALLIALIGAGFGGGGGLLLLMLLIGSTDSILREQVPEKLEALDRLRQGYILSHEVGQAFLRGLALGLILIGLLTLLLFLFPHARIHLDSSYFVQDVTLNPFLSWFTLTLWYIPFVFFSALFGTFLFQRWLQHRVAIPILFAFFIALLQFLPYDLLPIFYIFLIGGILGFLLGWIYTRYELLTLLIAGISFYLILTPSSGWLVEDAPFWVDTLFAYLLLGAIFVLGFIALRWGKTAREIPPYVPEYIQELRKQERIQRELEIARQVQLSFLPQQMPTLPGLDIRAVCIPALEVGGDYYDFILPDTDRTLLTVVGDVSGKGIEAAFYMTLIKGMLQALGMQFTGPRTILNKLNRLFYVHHRPGTFMSMTCVRVDTKRQEMAIARAGHMPLLLARANTGRVESLAPAGTAIGLLEAKEFELLLQEQTLRMHPGDTLLLYTDGLTEARNPEGKLFGEERLLELFTQHWHLPATEIADILIEEVYRFSDTRTLYDDLTLVVIKLL